MKENQKNPKNQLKHRLQRYEEVISYVVDNLILCCAGECKKGKWHEDYYKEHGHWWKKWETNEDGSLGERRYPNYPKEIDKGCFNCGGGGVIAHKYKCPGGCNKDIWHSPWPMTMYEGKEYRSFCGTDLVNTRDGSVCVDCAEKKYGGSGNIFESSGSGGKQEKSGQD